MKNKLTVIDFFCWAWGFSEGFRQQWFNIIKWIDFWQTAIDTHNLNHNLNDTTKNILDFWNEDDSNIEEINKLENSEIIIWSPSCVSFSSSNKSWKADKSLWIQLIEAYLRVIAVKKHQPNSKLIAWYMENVPNSRKYVQKEYTFDMLNLWKWAESIWKIANSTALVVKENGEILNSWDFWAPQSRQRFIAWEWCKTWEFVNPIKTHINYRTLWEILDNLPKPNLSQNIVKKSKFNDPNYDNLELNWIEITDHFYDTGLYKIEWEKAQDSKINHICMWKMSFPENHDKPCRTIMATRSAKTRESLILDSEYKRIWNWQYRLPTIREISTLMGFPLSYQFTWSEWSKWRQVWNAVSPHLSSALAKAILNKIWIEPVSSISFDDLNNHFDKIKNLNTFIESNFDNPKKRQKDAKFRRPIFKKNNITVDLLNYDDNNNVWKNWYIKVFFWTWIWYKHIEINKKHIKLLEEILKIHVNDFDLFKKELDYLHNNVIWKINIKELQGIYENDLHIKNNKNPINIRNFLNDFINKKTDIDKLISDIDFMPKNEVPKSQLLTIYSLWNLIFN